MRCKTHRRYKAKLPPRCNCFDCWVVYLDKHPSLEIVEKEIHDRTYREPGGTYVENCDTEEMLILNLLFAKRKELKGEYNE